MTEKERLTATPAAADTANAITARDRPCCSHVAVVAAPRPSWAMPRPRAGAEEGRHTCEEAEEVGRVL